MNNYPLILKVTLIVLIAHTHLHAVGSEYLPATFSDYTVKSKEIKKLEKQQEKIQFHNSHNRFAIKSGYVFAFLETKISFDLAKGNLSSNLSLEDNLGLPRKSYFFTGSFLYRIKPLSGIYALYYGINRLETFLTNKEYIFIN